METFDITEEKAKLKANEMLLSSESFLLLTFNSNKIMQADTFFFSETNPQQKTKIIDNCILNLHKLNMDIRHNLELGEEL